MKKTFCLLALSAGLYASPLLGQGAFKPESQYLRNPENAKKIVINEADYWKKQQKTLNPSIGFCPLSRLGYAFSKAFMLTGDTAYLRHARHALAILYKYGWDKTYGGWYFIADADGANPRDFTGSGKWSFTQHYGMLGPCAMFESTGGTSSWKDGLESDSTWLFRGLNLIDKKLWDSRAGYEGYYNYAAEDWSMPSMKGFTPTADGMTTHGAQMSMTAGAGFYRDRFFALADKMAEHIIPRSYPADAVIYEDLGDNWESPTAGGAPFVGHMVKCSWNLARAYLSKPSKELYRTQSNSLIDEVYRRNYYDSSNGGFVYMENGDGIVNTSKSHWTQEQGVLAGILNYFIAKQAQQPDKDKFLKMADGCMRFFEKYSIDTVNGGSYLDVMQDGDASNAVKSDMWEAGYHSAELGYQAYVYGSLLLYRKPVDLFYYYEAKPYKRVIEMNPMEHYGLIISQASLNGTAYSHYESASRLLTIPANQGGIFKIRYEYPQTPIGSIAVEETMTIQKREPVLLRAQPEPFFYTDAGAIEWEVLSGEGVSMSGSTIMCSVGKQEVRLQAKQGGVVSPVLTIWVEDKAGPSAAAELQAAYLELRVRAHQQDISAQAKGLQAMEVYSASGQLLSSSAAAEIGSCQVSTAGLKPGLYLLRLHTGGGVQARKIILK